MRKQGLRMVTFEKGEFTVLVYSRKPIQVNRMVSGLFELQLFSLFFQKKRLGLISAIENQRVPKSSPDV
jgi:hypothetical protein